MLDHLKIALEEFRDAVIQESKQNLARPQGKYNEPISSSGNLSSKIKGSDIRVSESSLEFDIEMPLYGFFIDKGVSGIEKKYNTPYSYKSKGGKNGLKGMPPPKKLDKWIVRRKLANRDAQGRFISRKSLQFAIAVGIFKKGIAPSLFFTRPFEKYYKKLPEQLASAFGLDAAELMTFVFKQNKK
tara:strand:+ start:7565 stop:8119 length:555 start_codon:yes stop_codon:yes gene_type:complete